MQELLFVMSFVAGSAVLALFVGLPLLYFFDTYVWPAVERVWRRLTARWHHGAPGDRH